MKHYNEIKSNYRDGNFTCIDAWETDDENEEGKVIAVVHNSGDVYYIDKRAMYDEQVTAEINKVLTTIKD